MSEQLKSPLSVGLPMDIRVSTSTYLLKRYHDLVNMSVFKPKLFIANHDAGK